MGIPQKFMDLSQYKKNHPIFPQAGWVWRAEIRMQVERERAPLARGVFGQLLLRVSLQSFLRPVLGEGGKAPLLAAPLWFLTQRTDVSDPTTEILQLLGVAVPWKSKCPAPFPAVWLSLPGPGNNKGFSAITLLGICLRKGS